MSEDFVVSVINNILMLDLLNDLHVKKLLRKMNEKSVLFRTINEIYNVLLKKETENLLPGEESSK